jgi:hypothetical protein
MNPNPGNDNSYLHDEIGVRQAAMLVINELGENAATYATTRAIVLQKQGDEMVPLHGAVSPQWSRKCSGREPPGLARTHTAADHVGCGDDLAEIWAIFPDAT